MLVASGRGKALPFLMLGSVTQMQSRMEASPQNKSTASMRVRRRECTPADCYKWNKAPLHHWCLIPPEESMADECKRYHSSLAELLSTKKGEDYSTTMSWIRAKVSFALLRSALLCLRGSRCTRRAPLNITDNDFEIDKELARF